MLKICTICGKQFTFPNTLENHIKRFHQSGNSELKSRKNNFITIKQTRNFGISLNCNLCNYKASSKRDILKHKANQRKCEKCSKVLCYGENLEFFQTHVENCTGQIFENCEISENENTEEMTITPDIHMIQGHPS